MTAFTVTDTARDQIASWLKSFHDAHHAIKQARSTRTLQERVLAAVGSTPAVEAKAAAGKPALMIQYVVTRAGDNWCEVERIKLGAAKNKKPRKMHVFKVSEWVQSLARNGYKVQYMDLDPVYAVATKGA